MVISGRLLNNNDRRNAEEIMHSSWNNRVGIGKCLLDSDYFYDSLIYLLYYINFLSTILATFFVLLCRLCLTFKD